MMGSVCIKRGARSGDCIGSGSVQHVSMEGIPRGIHLSRKKALDPTVKAGATRALRRQGHPESGQSWSCPQVLLHCKRDWAP